MAPPEPLKEKPNPERRSDAAVLCLCIGFSMIVLSWVLGVGGIVTAALGGSAPPAMAGGIMAIVLLPLAGATGAIMVVVGLIWILARVIADGREEHARDRYSREVER